MLIQLSRMDEFSTSIGTLPRVRRVLAKLAHMDQHFTHQAPDDRDAHCVPDHEVELPIADLAVLVCEEAIPP